MLINSAPKSVKILGVCFMVCLGFVCVGFGLKPKKRVKLLKNRDITKS